MVDCARKTILFFWTHDDEPICDARNLNGAILRSEKKIHKAHSHLYAWRFIMILSSIVFRRVNVKSICFRSPANIYNILEYS